MGEKTERERTIEVCVHDAVSWGKKNNKDPQEVLQRVKQALGNKGIAIQDQDYIATIMESKSQELGYDAHK